MWALRKKLMYPTEVPRTLDKGMWLLEPQFQGT
jgi:hypothetical protein